MTDPTPRSAPCVRRTAGRLGRTLFGIALALAAAARPDPASAFTYGDTLTAIWRPLPNIAAIHTPAETLLVWANAPSGATGWSATLKRGTLLFPLTPATLAYDATYQRWHLRFLLPSDAPDVLYDLIVSRSGAPPDTARNAVRLLAARKTSWYFLHMSDTHLVTHLYYYQPGADTDTSEMADFQAVIDDANLINPEFVIHTGDLVNEGELEEFLDKYYWSRSQAKMDELDVPFFLSSGNHDIGGWDATPPPAGTARRNWWRYFGWPYLDNPPPGVAEHSQNYWFDYGPVRMIGLEAYNNSGSYDDFEPATYGTDSFTQEQLDWLAATIAATPPGMKKVAFYHYDFKNQLNNNLVPLGLDAGLWGHNHSVPEGNLTTPPYSLGVQAVTDGKRTYRLIRVAPDGTLTPRPMLTAGSTGQNLRVSFSPANDGTNSTVTGTIVNDQTETFEHALLKFLLPDGSSYQTSAGTIVRQYSEGGFRHVDVNLPAPASSTVATTVSPATGVGPSEGVQGLGPGVPFLLHTPAPNPIRDRGRFAFSIPRDGEVVLEVFDIAGARVGRMAGRYGAGTWSVDWSTLDGSGRPLPTGLYLARAAFEGATRSVKVVILR